MHLKPKLYFKIIQKYPYLSKFLTLDNGFIPEKEKQTDYVLGADNGIDKKVLQENGIWKDFLPVEERQSGKIETMSCVSQSLLNVIETLIKKKWEENKNYSDRFLSKISNTSKRGNSMRNVIDTLRKKGVVKQDLWDNDFSSWSNYYRNIPVNIQEKAQLWLKEYEVAYEMVPDMKQTMIEALKYSPLWTSGFAWYTKDGLYRSYGNPNHAFTIIGYVENSHWIAFDSYAPFIKLLDWNFNFAGTKSIYLKRKSEEYNQKAIKELEAKGIKYIVRPNHNGEFYRVKNDSLEHIPNIRDIADDLTEYMKEKPNNINEVLEFLTNKEKIKWMTEEAYFDLLK